jgi:two-component system nitrogen regulation response regulator NtrX
VRPLLYIGCPQSERVDLERLLAAGNLGVVYADSAAAALAELQRREVPVVIDLSRGPAALQAARDLRAQHPELLVFAVVDARRPELTTEAILTGVADVFARPPSARRVTLAIDRELSYASTASHVPDAATAPLYHESKAMHAVMKLVTRAATMRAGVMISGEDGTGRQVVARAIHAAQPRPGPFVCVDCAALEGERLDAELFGASSSGRSADGSGGDLERIDRGSRLHESCGGTLYLQNVADASTRVQARLARVLRDREAILSEGGESIMVDVRPMAGVDPSIDLAIEDGRLRDDLFRRLSVIRIDVPPLRSRREDLPALANYLVREVCAALGVAPKTLSRPALALLAALPWRGNALELRSLIDMVVRDLGATRTIGVEDVLAHVRLNGGAVTEVGGTLRQARARFERDYITAVLEQHHGRISEAAKALGIQRTNLYRKLRALRVSQARRRK